MIQAISQQPDKALSDVRTYSQLLQYSLILLYNFFQFMERRITPNHETANYLDAVDFGIDPGIGNVNTPISGSGTRCDDSPVPAPAWNGNFFYRISKPVFQRLF